MRYVKIRVGSPYINTDRHELFEVHDEFDPENNAEDAEELQQLEEMAVWEYVDTSYEIIDGDMKEDEDH